MVEYLCFAQKAFIVKNKKLLLIRKSIDAPNCAGKWEVPGGRMEIGEDLNSHLMREVYEEVGLNIVPVEPFYVWEWYTNENRGMQHIVAVAIICHAENCDVSFHNHDITDYIDSFEWVDFSRVNEYDFIDNMRPVVMRFIEKYL